jgi:DHA1 family bicyclomycin/chloramphenicol resistance-like MFS transporter
MAQAMMLFAISPAIAPVIGGWLHDAFGWRSIFWFLGGYSISVFLFVFLTAQESLAKHKRNSIYIQEVSRVYFRTLTNPHYLRLVFILACAFSSFFLYVAGAPTLLFDVLHLQANQFYLLFIPVVSGIMIGAFISNRLISIITNKQMVQVFLSAMLLVAVTNLVISKTLEPSITNILIPLVFYSISLATIMPIFSIMVLNCFPHNRGSASAMQSFIQMGFNGIIVSIVITQLGASLQNFAYTQVTLVGIAYILWLFDRFIAKGTP